VLSEESLGWKSVPVTYVDLKEVVRGEFAENAFCKDFLPSKIEAIRRAIEPYERAAAKERQRSTAGLPRPPQTLRESLPK
jgi:hypothetical protein